MCECYCDPYRVDDLAGLQDMSAREIRKTEERMARSLVLSKVQEPRSTGEKKVRELLDLLIQAERLRLSIIRAAGESTIRSGLRRSPSYRLGSCVHFATPELRRLNSEYSEYVMTINELLAGQSWVPQLRDNDLGGMIREYQAANADSELGWMAAAMNWLLRQAQGRGPIAAPVLRFQECRRCGNLFYKGVAHQRFCGDDCYERDKVQRPSYRKTRRTYMRRRRDKADEKRLAHAQELLRRVPIHARDASGVRARLWLKRNLLKGDGQVTLNFLTRRLSRGNLSYPEWWTEPIRTPRAKR
jgi:hypothetical protein